MWFECDAEDVRENRRRSFEERKRNSKGPAGFVVAQLHIDRERRLGAKSARIPSVARIGPRATRLGEELEPIFTNAVLQQTCVSKPKLRSSEGLSPKRMATRGSVTTP